MWPSLDQNYEPKINFSILNFEKLNLFLYVWCVYVSACVFVLMYGSVGICVP